MFQLSPLGRQGVCIQHKDVALTCPTPRVRMAQMSLTESRLSACVPDKKRDSVELIHLNQYLTDVYPFIFPLIRLKMRQNEMRI